MIIQQSCKLEIQDLLCLSNYTITLNMLKFLHCYYQQFKILALDTSSGTLKTNQTQKISRFSSVIQVC